MGINPMISRNDIFNNLQRDILRLQGFKHSRSIAADIGLGPVMSAFPNSVFPLGAVHEFIADKRENAACSVGFIAGLLSFILGDNGAALWISSDRTIFPPALKRFGLEPDRFIFIDLKKEKDVFWVMNEALKCDALSAVVGEMKEIDFKSSRRLQLAVEHNQTTGFIIRNNVRRLNTTACVSRWRITSSASALNNLPGLGFPKWNVELLRMRNGKSGAWTIQWRGNRFLPIHHEHVIPNHQQKKAG